MFNFFTNIYKIIKSILKERIRHEMSLMCNCHFLCVEENEVTNCIDR